MANWWDNLGTGLGNALIGVNNPFGLAPPENYDRNAAIRQGALSLGVNVLANADQNPAVALGRGYRQAQAIASDNQQNAMAAEAMMAAAAEKKRKRQEEQEQKDQFEQFVSTLPPDQQPLARMFPDKFGAAVIGQKFPDPQGAPNMPAAIQEYEYARAQGFPGTFQDWEASKKGGMSLQVDPETGQVTFQQGANIKPMTEAQSKDTVFATRAEGALKVFEPVATAMTSLKDKAVSNIPGFGNYMKSPEYQQAEQAGREFLAAILRKDTGAAVTPQEVTEYGTVYLPAPGDGPDVLSQKAASRKRAVDALKAGMTPQAILAQESALKNGDSAPTTNTKRLKFNPDTGELE